jgi:dihydroxyacid dehydratase/phosphogluconate dehydratase
MNSPKDGFITLFDGENISAWTTETGDWQIEDDILVLKNNGPVGYPGFPETGNMALPPKLLKEGVRDMVRISDARMSGTAFGTVVLHVAPEAAVGGPLALIQNGDRITLDVPGRSLELHVDTAELEKRLENWQAPEVPEDEQRGYALLYRRYVTQADTGADFEFLVGKSGAKLPKSSH